MKAFVMKAIGQVGFIEKPIPQPGPDDAIVKTTVALVCTSDAHTVGGAIGPRENLTLGHEAVGTVSEVGSNVKLFKPGDRVVVGSVTPDWGDPYAQAGHPTESGPAMALGGMTGYSGEMVDVPAPGFQESKRVAGFDLSAEALKT